MCSPGDSAALPTLGCPIRESADQRLFSAYPRLIAAVHALHRLLVPRHPPCALTILTVISRPMTRPRANAARLPARPEGRAAKPATLGDTRLAIAVRLSRTVKRRDARERGLTPEAGRPPARAGLSKLDSMRARTARYARQPRQLLVDVPSGRPSVTVPGGPRERGDRRPRAAVLSRRSGARFGRSSPEGGGARAHAPDATHGRVGRRSGASQGGSLERR